MKQQVVSSNGSSPSPSPAAARTRASRPPPPKAKQPSAAPGVKARPRTTTTTTTMAAAAAAARRQLPMAAPVPVRRAMSTKDKEESNKEETVEQEVVRLRGEVEALRREVQRLLRLNADLALAQRGQSKAVNSSDLPQQQQDNHDAATNRPQPPNKTPGGAPARPPPPPPPPPRQQKRQGPSAPTTSPVSKATALVDMYNSLTNNKKPQQHADRGSSHHHHSSIVGELQNRSRHLLAIKADVETKAEFIDDLIKKIHTSTYADVEQVLTFVDWLDQQLSTLSDETAVLKHFNWPERKADALREAASEYRHLKCLLADISSLNDDGGSPSPCDATLRKISSLLDKLEKCMNRLVNLRSSAMPSYKELRIPTDWMLDSGIASKMRLASVNLAKIYTKRVLKELDGRDTAGNEAALVAQSVRFTYRVHQFAGGLDSEAMHAFEELRRRVRPVSSSS
ncbi:Protein CHUP1, chloroplastic [Dichanthelium oligosanthes]|uniref:Protein CHUP1, chloroplastic n=1 Tax=Dichanthelium oligosanthes TaxID=888268 RepID=A0A1E5VEQ4_9POAL|nr:Protein CHUP1, chloroplastic [Dichanthelium oligosanthes]